MFFSIESSLEFRVARAAENKIGLPEFIKLSGDFESKMVQDNSLNITRHFVNNYNTIEEFGEKSLVKFDFSDKTIMRPSWDKYFM